MFPMMTRRGTAVLPDPRRMDRLFNDVFSTLAWGDGLPREAESVAAWVPAVDVVETAEGLRIVAELPGVRPEDVKLSVENGVLTLRGEKRQEEESKPDTVHRYERSFGAFQRSFQLPSSVDADRIEARVEHGMLTVTLPKAEKAKPREIAIKRG